MKRLINRDVKIKYALCISLEFEDRGKRTGKNVNISEGDKVMVQYYDAERSNILSCKAKVSRIIHLPSRSPNDVSIQVDASIDFSSKTFIIPVNNILDIELLEEENQDVVIPIVPQIPQENMPAGPQNICWSIEPITLDESGSMTLLKIPYCRNEPGTIFLHIKDTAGHTFFKEKFAATNINFDASFTWSLRTFAGVAKKLEDAGVSVLTDQEGFFIFQNGAELDPIIAETDRDNSLIIPAGTVLDIDIIHNTNIAGDNNVITKINRRYVVTENDVNKVTYKG